jgi:hypothetical protein
VAGGGYMKSKTYCGIRYLGFPIGVAEISLLFDLSIREEWEGGYAVAQLFEALRYKPEGRGFDSRWCHWNLSLT